MTCVLVLLPVVLALSACAPSKPPAPPLDWKAALTTEALNRSCSYPLQWTIESRIDGQKTLVTAAASLANLSSGQHYAIGLVAGPSGALWNVDDYRNRRATFQKTFPEKNAAALAAEFPAIGQRAMRQLESFGPEGAAQSLTFTTLDSRNDVKLTLSARLPGSVADPKCDLEKLAKEIDNRTRQ